MRKIAKLLLMIVIGSLLSIVTSCKNPTEIDNRPTFTVGMECAYAPFNWTENVKSDTNYPIEGTNLYEWRHGDWLSDIRLNAIHENIVKLNNMTADDIEYTTNGNETVQDALDMLLGVDSEEVVVPIISDKVTTTNYNQELIS